MNQRNRAERTGSDYFPNSFCEVKGRTDIHKSSLYPMAFTRIWSLGGYKKCLLEYITEISLFKEVPLVVTQKWFVCLLSQPPWMKHQLIKMTRSSQYFLPPVFLNIISSEPLHHVQKTKHLLLRWRVLHNFSFWKKMFKNGRRLGPEW